MKKLISLLLIVAMLTICLCSCDINSVLEKLPWNDSEQTQDDTTTTPDSTDEDTTTTVPEETTTTTGGAWSPNAGKDDKKPIELPGIGVKPTIG